MKTKTVIKALCIASAAAALFAQAAAEKVLKLGTVGVLVMPIGDAIATATKHLRWRRSILMMPE
jgi:hypothetical protein